MRTVCTYHKLSLPLWLIAAAVLLVGLTACKRKSSGGTTITRTELKALIAANEGVGELEKRATAHFPGKGYSFSAIHGPTNSSDPMKSLMPTYYGLPDDTWDTMMGLIEKHKLSYDKEHDRITCDCSQHGN